MIKSQKDVKRRIIASDFNSLIMTIPLAKYKFGLKITGGPHGIYGTKFFFNCLDNLDIWGVRIVAYKPFYLDTRAIFKILS